MAGRIVGMISLLTIVGVVVAAAVLLLLALDSEEETGRSSAQVLAESVARSLLEVELDAANEAEIDAVIRLNRSSLDDGEPGDAGDIWVFNAQGRVAASTEGSRIAASPEIRLVREAMTAGRGTIVEALGAGRYSGTTAVRGPDGEARGAVRVEFTTAQIGTQFTLYRVEFIAAVALFLVALVAGAWFLARRLARPIGLMVQAARAVEGGRQPEPGVAAALRNTSLTRDEYGELAGVFLDMAREVGAREIRLNALVEERTVELSEKNVALEDAQREIRNDLEMAHSVQAALVPSELPQDPRAGVAAFMTPAREVGGDFYDAFITDDGRLAFAIADVSGKGVASALMMAVGRSLLRSAANLYPDPSEAVASTNDQLCAMNPKELFITAFFGVIDLELGTLTYVNAGHDPPYLLRPGEGPEMIPHTGGMALGVLPDLTYAETTLPLDAGTAMYLYTDGITEAENATGQQFGRERLEARLSENGVGGPQELMESVLGEIRGFTEDAQQFDDITCMAVQFIGGASVVEPHIPGRGDSRLASGWRRMVVQPTLESSLPRVAAFVERFGASEGLSTSLIYRVNLAMDELLTNTLEHGFAGRVEEAEITVSLRIEGDEVVVRYEDNGPEFDTVSAVEQDTELGLEERPLGGLGLQLVASTFDGVTYERVDGCNVTTLRRNITSADTGTEAESQPPA